MRSRENFPFQTTHSELIDRYRVPQPALPVFLPTYTSILPSRFTERERTLLQGNKKLVRILLLDEILAFCPASLFLFVKLIRSTIALTNNTAKSVLDLLYPLPITNAVDYPGVVRLPTIILDMQPLIKGFIGICIHFTVIASSGYSRSAD